MQKPERSIEERAEDAYRSAYYEVMPANWNRAQRRTAQGKVLTLKAQLAAERARADYLEEQLGIREGCKVLVEAMPANGGHDIVETRVDPEGFDNTNPDWNDPRNWTEDYPHENGQYMNRCMTCRRIFYGHKRRAVCKSCTIRAPKQLDLEL